MANRIKRGAKKATKKGAKSLAEEGIDTGIESGAGAAAGGCGCCLGDLFTIALLGVGVGVARRGLRRG